VTGPEHYREAERLLNTAVNTSSSSLAADCRELAQAHATLALAAATALPVTRVLLAAEYQAWADVAAVKTEPKA
jgi:hypothetical protein